MDIKLTDILKHFVVDTLMILALPVAFIGAFVWEVWNKVRYGPQGSAWPN